MTMNKIDIITIIIRTIGKFVPTKPNAIPTMIVYMHVTASGLIYFLIEKSVSRCSTIKSFLTAFTSNLTPKKKKIKHLNFTNIYTKDIEPYTNANIDAFIKSVDIDKEV